jgi:hypothetical protein
MAGPATSKKLGRDVRSLYGPDLLKEAFEFGGQRAALSKVELSSAPGPVVAEPHDDVSFIQAHASFDTSLGSCWAVFNLIRVNGEYKAWTLATLLESIQ